MVSKRFTLLIALRVILLAGIITLTVWLAANYQLKFTLALLVLISIGQVAELIYFTERVNRELKKFLEALKYEDYAVGFGSHKLGGSFKELDQNFNDIIETVKSSKAEKQSQAELLKMALEHIRLGLLILDSKDNILLMNTAAQQMLNIPHFHTWQMLSRKKPEFTGQLGDFEFEGRKLIELEDLGTPREFYLDLDHISLLGVNYRMITFSDLKNEIEQKEIDAWHKLIRILSHEVMNSVTPVSSLSETIKNMLTDQTGTPLQVSQLDQERINDIILALDTVIRRSQGMLHFVDQYRKLTQLPAPHLEVFSLELLFREVLQLMHPEAEAQKIKLDFKVPNKKLALKADRKLIEQVLINLIGNAFHALEEIKDPEVSLTAIIQDSSLMIQVKDNGAGIPEDILPSIFIPFFSTRKNGTGIGLTLSKNIMKLHRGNIAVQSKEGEGTIFTLTFML